MRMGGCHRKTAEQSPVQRVKPRLVLRPPRRSVRNLVEGLDGAVRKVAQFLIGRGDDRSNRLDLAHRPIAVFRHRRPDRPGPGLRMGEEHATNPLGLFRVAGTAGGHKVSDPMSARVAEDVSNQRGPGVADGVAPVAPPAPRAGWQHLAGHRPFPINRRAARTSRNDPSWPGSSPAGADRRPLRVPVTRAGRAPPARPRPRPHLPRSSPRPHKG